MAFLHRRDGRLRRPKTQRGFTLLEIFVPIAILAIVVGFAIPMFGDVIRNTTVSNQTNDLVTALSTARSEAVRRGMQVAVVSTNGGADWSGGWQVVADTNRDGNFVAPDEVISTAPALGAQYHVYAKNAAGADGQIVFNINGALATTGFDLNVCFPSGEADKSRRIRVRASGNVSSHKNTTGSPAAACPST